MQFNVFAWNEFAPVPGAQFPHSCSLRPHFRGAHSSSWSPHSQLLLWLYDSIFLLVAFYRWWWTFSQLNLRNICCNNSFCHGLWVSFWIPFWGRRGSTVSMRLVRLCRSWWKSWDPRHVLGVCVCQLRMEQRKDRDKAAWSQLQLWKPFPWHMGVTAPWAAEHTLKYLKGNLGVLSCYQTCWWNDEYPHQPWAFCIYLPNFFQGLIVITSRVPPSPFPILIPITRY